MKKITFLLILTTQICFGQSEIITETINKIEFKEDTVKSVFVWIAKNIKYDVKKLKAIKEGSSSKRNLNFKSEKEYKNHLINKTVKQKKGVCEDYSLLFKTILEELGYEAHVIEGYTKINGKINRKVGHAWNAVKINQEWKLFDATWAAGSIRDGKKFIQNYSEQWYDVDPNEMIKTHMPFDPIWQLLSKPITYSNFEEKSQNDLYKENYQFNHLIEKFFSNEKDAQMKDQVNRSKEMGEGIRMIGKWRKRMTKQIGLYGITSQQNILEEAQDNAQNAVNLFNEYANAKNKQFKGKKWTIEKAEKNLMASKEEIEGVIKTYQGIEVEDSKTKNALNKAIRFSEKLLKSIDKEVDFLTKFKSR